jgi:hypothetical protein
LRPYHEKKKPFTKIGLVQWLKVKTLSSSPSTTKKKTKNPVIQWLMPVILAPEEAEIRRNVVLAIPGKKLARLHLNQ